MCPLDPQTGVQAGAHDQKAVGGDVENTGGGRLIEDYPAGGAGGFEDAEEAGGGECGDGFCAEVGPSGKSG